MKLSVKSILLIGILALGANRLLVAQTPNTRFEDWYRFKYGRAPSEEARLVPGLTSQDLRVDENGVAQHISVFTSDRLPLSVTLVIDQSVTHDTMEKINDSLAALHREFSPYDEMSVFTKNGVTMHTAFTAAQSARLGAVLQYSKGIGRDPLMGLTGPLAHDSVINNMPVDGSAP